MAAIALRSGNVQDFKSLKPEEKKELDVLAEHLYDLFVNVNKKQTDLSSAPDGYVSRYLVISESCRKLFGVAGSQAIEQLIQSYKTFYANKGDLYRAYVHEATVRLGEMCIPPALGVNFTQDVKERTARGLFNLCISNICDIVKQHYLRELANGAAGTEIGNMFFMEIYSVILANRIYLYNKYAEKGNVTSPYSNALNPQMRMLQLLEEKDRKIASLEAHVKQLTQALAVARASVEDVKQQAFTADYLAGMGYTYPAGTPAINIPPPTDYEAFGPATLMPPTPSAPPLPQPQPQQQQQQQQQSYQNRRPEAKAPEPGMVSIAAAPVETATGLEDFLESSSSTNVPPASGTKLKVTERMDELNMY